MRLGEREVVGGCVVRGTEDDSIERCKSLGTVTQALTLNCSTTCRGLWIPPQQHPMTLQIREMNVRAVFVGQFEIRRKRVQRQHRQILTPCGAAAWPPASAMLRSGT